MVVYKITVADSVEERILELQEKKRELANAAFGDGALGKAKAAKLSMKDILYLFRRDAENPSSSVATKGFGARTKILAKPPVKQDEERGVAYSREVPGRYVSPEVEESIERRRAGEIANPYGRR